MTTKRGFGSLYQQKKRKPDGTAVVLPTWWIKYSKNGQVFRESSESHDQRAAERLLKKRLGEVVTGKFAGLAPERIRFSELADAVVEDYTDNDRATVGDVKRRLKLHLLPAFGEIRAADFGTRDLKRYIAKRRREEATNATINRELAIVKRAFRIAAKSDPPLVNRVPHVPMLQENNIRTGFLEHDAYTKLRNELPEHLRALFVVGFHVGSRVGELESLQWSQVDFTAKRIMLRPGETKNGEGRWLPIYGEMLHWLQIEKDIRDAKYPRCLFVFQQSGEKLRRWRKDWDAACVRAEVSGLLFHDLRRTAVRNMVRAGIPEKTAMAISGHKTRSIFDRYNIVNDRDLTEAAAKMEQHLSDLGILPGIPAAEKEKKPDAKKPATPLQ